MKCPACGRERDNAASECPFCKAPTQQQKKKPDGSRISIPPKTLGICPDCGTEQVGTTYDQWGTEHWTLPSHIFAQELVRSARELEGAELQRLRPLGRK